MRVTALLQEIDRNTEIASATRDLIRDERDMLQGTVRERLALHRYHTDVWDAAVSNGTVDALGDEAAPVAACYGRLKEVNELVAVFDSHGSPIMYAPLVTTSAEPYRRDDLIDIIADRCGDVLEQLRRAREAAEVVQDRTCNVCGEVFPDQGVLQEHGHER